MYTLSNLVQIHRRQAQTTSEIVAKGCGIQHKNLMVLIPKYADEFSELGEIAFETRKFQGSPTEYVFLNEDQATFAITRFCNTPVVLRGKLTLSKAFHGALDQIERVFTNPPRQDLLTDKRKAGRSPYRCLG